MTISRIGFTSLEVFLAQDYGLKEINYMGYFRQAAEKI
jgi:hypothetical protein